MPWEREEDSEGLQKCKYNLFLMLSAVYTGVHAIFILQTIHTHNIVSGVIYVTKTIFFNRVCWGFF